MTRDELISKFYLLTTGNPGIESLIHENSDTHILDRILDIDQNPLSKVQFNQVLGLAKEIGVSDGFFKYYWLSDEPALYDVRQLSGYSVGYSKTEAIESVDQLYWGLYRLFVDGLLNNGNVRAYFRSHANLTFEKLKSKVEEAQIDTAAIKRRGPALPFAKIAKDKRYLISEIACKTYGEAPETESLLKTFLVEAYKTHVELGGGAVTVRELVTGDFAKKRNINQLQFTFSADDIMDDVIKSETDIETKYMKVAHDFINARQAALENTDKYLSLVNDLDVYVATSMRTRKDFREMGDTCEQIFEDPRIKNLHLRFFDPTISAAEGHQDKGLIECLMVKCARVLIYCAGSKESYGKDAEAAMALSLGKPVIFYCSKQDKADFYRKVHPLSRLINFETGVAVGAFVVDNISDIVVLLQRIYENSLQYDIQQPKSGYLELHERKTDSIVRLQTNDQMLSEAFWNYYRSRRQ